jgi:hypothetical protein
MTDKEFDKRLRKIAETAKAQAEGPYTAQSDAVASLHLIETLALLLIENYEAKHNVKLTAAPPPTGADGEGEGRG